MAAIPVFETAITIGEVGVGGFRVSCETAFDTCLLSFDIVLSQHLLTQLVPT